MARNVEALITEIRSDLSKYADAGLIDDNSLYRDIVKGLKRFGNDITELQEAVIEVKNGYGQLPEGFFSLYFAYLCEPLYYKKVDVESHDLQSSYFYIERTRNTNRWSECESCCNTEEETVIKENLYFNRGKVEYYYHRPQLLKLGKAFRKNECHRECRNKIVKDNPNEIVIIDGRLQANFNEGSIYIQYFGLPLDEEGLVDIPDTANDTLETYLEYHLKRRLAERLMGNNDGQNLAALYQVYAQQESVALKNTSGVLKMSKINPTNLRSRIKRLNKLESLSYEVEL